MDREKYLAELEEYLQPLTPEERADAIMFYSEFIEDAGLENRSQIEQRLGTPKQLSRKVLADHSIKMTDEEVKYQRTATPRSNVKMIWLILLALLASPFLLGASGVMIFVLIGILALVAGLIFGAVVALCALVVVMGLLFYVGIGLLFTNWAVGLFYLGLGALALGALLIVLPIAYWLVRLVLQGIANFSKYLYDKLSKKRKAKGGSDHEEDI